MKKVLSTITILIIAFLILSIGYNILFPLDKHVMVEYLNSHAKSKSSNCCALYCAMALWHGGKPVLLLPAWAYKYYLPFNGCAIVKKKNYKPEEGDIVVFPANKNHIFGHIAIYNGEQWVSDFKQKSIIVNPSYNTEEMTIFRDDRENYAC